MRQADLDKEPIDEPPPPVEIEAVEIDAGAAADQAAAEEALKEMAVVDSPFSEEEKVALVKHLNWALGEAGGAPDEHVGARLPLNPHTDSWLEALPDGLPLSKFVMHVDPEALDARALNIPKDGAPLSAKDALQNHTLCSNAATGIGCGITNLQPQQLHKAADNEQVPAGLPSRACLPRVSRPRRTPHTPRFSQSPPSPARHTDNRWCFSSCGTSRGTSSSRR